MCIEPDPETSRLLTRNAVAGERDIAMRRSLVFLFCFLVLGSPALADGVGPERKMTEAEASTFAAVRNTIQSALPAARNGYEFKFAYVSEFSEGMVPESIGAGEMFRMSYEATYTFDNSNAAAQQMSMYMDRAKGTPEQQAMLAELDAKGAELKKARDSTRDRGEKEKIRAALKVVRDRADSLQTAIMADYQAWVASGGAATAAQDMQKTLPAKELSVRIVINQTISVLDTASHYEVEGVPLAFDKAEGCAGYDTYCLTLLIGPFAKTDKVSGRDRYKLPDVAPGVPTKARGIAVMIGGPKDKPEAVRELLQQIDLAKLKALVL